MYDHARAVDLIEKSVDARPFCSCGRHTTPVWRDGVVWLECSSLSDPRDGVVARFLAVATSPTHVRAPIVSILEDGLPVAALPGLASAPIRSIGRLCTAAVAVAYERDG